MVRIAFSTVSAPPARFIGSELMTFGLARRLSDAGHDVSVHPSLEATEPGEFNGVRIDPTPIPADADVVVCHPDYGIRARRARKSRDLPVVAICHNAHSGVKVGLINTRPDLVVVNSETMRAALNIDALVVHPPAPEVVRMRPGRCVTALSLNDLKGGPQFWETVAALPHVPFLAVQSGYGTQHAPISARNARILPHLPPDALNGRVWRHTGIFLQLSESESWGMAAAEAIAHGIPVIAHPTPGIVENLGDAAFYVDRDDIKSIASAIVDIRSNPAPFAAAAYARAEEHARTSERQLTEWVAAIEGLV